MKKRKNPWLYGFLAGFGLLAFYVSVLTIFQDFNFAVLNLRNYWPWTVPLAAGFGAQIGLYSSIMHNAAINGEIAASGTISGGSMVACCSHFLLNIIPIIGLSALGTVLMAYQKAFFSIGIISNIAGVSLMWNHKRKMEALNNG